jgi:hypothetical protein
MSYLHAQSDAVCEKKQALCWPQFFVDEQVYRVSYKLKCCRALGLTAAASAHPPFAETHLLDMTSTS